MKVYGFERDNERTEKVYRVGVRWVDVVVDSVRPDNEEEERGKELGSEDAPRDK